MQKFGKYIVEMIFLGTSVTSDRRMAENGFPPPPPPREFCRHILSCRELKAESFKCAPGHYSVRACNIRYLIKLRKSKLKVWATN